MCLTHTKLENIIISCIKNQFCVRCLNNFLSHDISVLTRSHMRKSLIDVAGRDRSLNVGQIFIYIHTLCMRAANALASLHICAGSPEPSLLENAKYQNITCWLNCNRSSQTKLENKIISYKKNHVCTCVRCLSYCPASQE